VTIRVRPPGVRAALGAVWAGFWAMPALAESQLQGAQVAADYLARLIGGLALVIGLILLLAWILRRIPGMPGPGQQVIEVLAVRSVGTRERLMLVQVGDEQILIGLTATGIRHIHTLRKNIVMLPTEPAPVDFASLLRRVTNKGSESSR